MADQTPQHENNWSAAGMRGMFDAVHRKRDLARHRQAVLLCVLMVALGLGVPLWITWNKFQDARRQTLLEEFASRRLSAEQLTLANPAIESTLQRADALRDSVQSRSVAESIPDLRQALALLAEAHDLDGNLERLRELLDPVGRTLLETPWYVSSEVIDNRQKDLSEHHATIVSLLDEGKIAQAQIELAQLLTKVGQLQGDNVAAMETAVTRQNWIRMQVFISDQLPDEQAGVLAILETARGAESAWAQDDWELATLRPLKPKLTQAAQRFREQQLRISELSREKEAAESQARQLQHEAALVAGLRAERDNAINELHTLQKDASEYQGTAKGQRQERTAAGRDGP